MDRSPPVNLVFVEFQNTTCLLATAAEMRFKRNIVAFQAGGDPGVPILTAAGGLPCGDALHRLGVARNPGKETPADRRGSVNNFPQQLHQLMNKRLRHALPQFRMMH